MSKEWIQMTLPLECPECQCGTVLNCACDWEVHKPYKEVEEYKAPEKGWITKGEISFVNGELKSFEYIN